MHKNNHKLRIGIIGAGNIVRTRHLPALKKHPEVEIVAVSNLTYESAENFCSENLPEATPIKNWPDLVALPDIDVVWIGTPRSEEHTSELQSLTNLVCRLLLEKKKSE